MALSVFDDESNPPDAARLRDVLGDAAALWDRVVSDVRAAHGPVEELWNFASAKFGWSMRLRLGERVVLYMTPGRAKFLVGAALGEAAVAAATAAGLPPAIQAALDAAPKYAEGRGLRFEVADAAAADAAVKIAAAKLAPRARGAPRSPRATRATAAKRSPKARPGGSA